MKITVPVTREIDINSLILDIAREHFKDTEIESVDVQEDYDHEGEKIMLVNILYSDENGRIDPALRVGFVRHLRPKLVEIGVHYFPYTEYMTKQDLKELEELEKLEKLEELKKLEELEELEKQEDIADASP